MHGEPIYEREKHGNSVCRKCLMIKVEATVLKLEQASASPGDLVKADQPQLRIPGSIVLG